jgi:hypothetical protein
VSKFTPGPWQVYPEGINVPHYDVCPRVVSDYPSGRSVSDPISDEDARLIAAAPDLLEAARLALQTLDEAGRGQSKAAHALSAALTKAGAL